MTKHEKIININDFDPKVTEGQVKFLMLDAKYDELETKKGVREIVQLKLELQNTGGVNGPKEEVMINLFIDYFEGGQFHRFLLAVAKGAGITAFQPSKLVGLKGQAKLSYNKPEGYDFAFPRLNDWVFYQRNDKVAKSLANYQTENESDVKGEDTNF